MSDPLLRDRIEQLEKMVSEQAMLMDHALVTVTQGSSITNRLIIITEILRKKGHWSAEEYKEMVEELKSKAQQTGVTENEN